MLRTLLRLGLLPTVMLVAIGCGPTTRTYSVTVKNDYSEPMTVWITKNGPPMETAWLPPEDIAMMRSLPQGVKLKGLILLPGETGDTTATGKFNSGVSAVLRVYRGQKTLQELFGISQDSPNRTDIELAPGDNRFVIDRTGTTVRQ